MTRGLLVWRTVLAAVVITTGLDFWNVTPATACSCVAFDQAAKLVRSEVVFTGTVIERRVVRPTFTSTASLLEFEVETVYKGTAAKRQGVVSAHDTVRPRFRAWIQGAGVRHRSPHGAESRRRHALQRSLRWHKGGPDGRRHPTGARTGSSPHAR